MTLTFSESNAIICAVELHVEEELKKHWRMSGITENQQIAFATFK